MSIKLASLNARGLRDLGKTARLLRDLLSFGVDVATIQETHFVCEADSRVLSNDFVVYSAYGNRQARGVSLLVKRSLDASVDLVHADVEGRLIVADIAVKSGAFRVVAVYAPNDRDERVAFYRRLEPFLVDSSRLVLVGDWNAILDPKIDRGRGAKGKARADRSLVNLINDFGLIDRYRADHPGREMWTWALRWPSLRVVSYLDRMLVRRVDLDLLDCPTFHRLDYSDHKLVCARVVLENRPRLAGYWKFNLSLLDRRDFREQLIRLVQRELVGAVIGNRWWERLKSKIRAFVTKFSQRLALDKANKMKALEDSLSRAEAGGDSLEIALAKEALRRSSSERYQGQVVRHKLNKMSNEAVNMGAELRKEEFRRGSDRFIREVVTPEGHTLRSADDMCEAFRRHFENRFTKEPGLRTDEFRSYLADFPRLSPTEAAGCEGEITESDVHSALKKVGRGKSPGLDGLPYELYLRLSHIFVPILTVVFNNWFRQGSVPRRITRGVITLLRKDKGGGGNLDNYRPITLLNTELKILAKILTERLQLVADRLLGPEQTCAVKGRTIQSNLHLIRTILEGVKDDDCAALINLDQSKAFDRVDHQYLATVLQAAGFKPDFCKWISLLYRAPSAVVQVNGKLSSVFALSRSVRQGCPLSPLLYALALEPLLRRLKDETSSPALRGIGVPGGARARVSAYADDVSAFVSSREDIEAVQKAVDRYEKVTGAKINRDKSSGLRLGAWKGVALPGPFSWTDGPVRILGVWFGPDLQLEKNWSEVKSKVEARVETWLRRRLSLKGRAEACATYVLPTVLYHLAVLPLCESRKVAIERLLTKLLWGGRKHWVRKETCYQRLSHGGLGLPHLASHRHASRLAFLRRVQADGDPVVARSVRDAFPSLTITPPVFWAERRRRSKRLSPFLVECRSALKAFPRSSDLSRKRGLLYHELVEGVAKDPLSDRLDLSVSELRSFWSWAPAADYLSNSEFSLSWRLIRDVLPLNDKLSKWGLANSPNCHRCDLDSEETASHAFYHCPQVSPFWEFVGELTARIVPDKIVPMVPAFVLSNVSPPFSGVKRMVFFSLLAVARMVVWTTRKEGILRGEGYSYQDLILFFKHQLRVKIRTDQKRLHSTDFSERWVKVASLVFLRGASLDFLF